MNRNVLVPALFILPVIVLSTGGCSLLQRGEQSSPQRVVQAYLEAFSINDFEAMLELSGGWEGSEAELEFTKQFIKMIELQRYEIGRVEFISDNEALVEVNFTMVLLGQEAAQTSLIRVARKERKWYIVEGLPV